MGLLLDNVGNTDLIMAVELQDNTSFTELLLSHGGDIESQDRERRMETIALGSES